MLKKHTIYWLMLLLIGGLVTTYLVIKINDAYKIAEVDLSVSSAATVPTLAVSPTTSNVSNGQTFSVNITMDTATSSTDGVDVLSLHFNPAVLQVVDDNTSVAGIQITPGTLLPVTVSNNSYNVNTNFDNNGTTVVIPAGTIRFSQATSGGGSAFSGAGTLATIHFTAIANGTSALTFDFTSGSGLDSNMAFQGTDVLAAVTNGSVTVTTPDTTAPTVSMTAPANGATVSGSSVTVSANASDNVGVAGVQFKLDGANIGSEDTASPYSITWNASAVANGSHTLTATARDSAGNTATSSGVSVTVNNPDTTAPTVSIAAPSAGASVSGSSVTISANASDNIGVAGVQFRVDGINVGSEDTTSPYSISWNSTTVSNGSHSLTAVARDAAGNTATSSSISVTVNNADTTVPTVSITAPASAATVSGSSVSVTANASDNIGVSGVQFKLDGANLGSEDTASPYSTTWNTTSATNGSHTLTAVARDAAGNTATSSSVSVTVNNADTTVPTVSLTAPANGATVSGSSVTVSANASDNIGVSGVQFKLDGANLGSEDTVSPYSTTWNTTTASSGSHTLTATARDAAGNTATATSISVTVSNSFTRTIQLDPEALTNKTISSTLSVMDTARNPIKSYAFTTNSSGSATITFDIAPQAVSLKISLAPYLTRVLSVDLNSTGTYTFPKLRVGDINQDNIVNSIDFSLLNGSWFTSTPSADLNKDGVVNSIDFSFMNQNWLVSGE